MRTKSIVVIRVGGETCTLVARRAAGRCLGVGRGAGGVRTPFRAQPCEDPRNPLSALSAFRRARRRARAVQTDRDPRPAAAAATRHRAVPKARLPRPATPAECTGRRDRRGSQRSHWFGCGPFDYLRHFSRLTHAAPYDNDPTHFPTPLENQLNEALEGGRPVHKVISRGDR